MHASVVKCVSFDDGSVLRYCRVLTTLKLEFQTWDNRIWALTFAEILGIQDFGVYDVVDFVDNDPRTSEFGRRLIEFNYDKSPDSGLYHEYKFIAPSGDVALSIVAKDVTAATLEKTDSGIDD